MVTVMTQVFFFDTDWPQVKCLRPGRRWNRLPYDSPFGVACEPVSLNSATAGQKASVVHLLTEVLSAHACKLCPGFVSRPGLAAKHMSGTLFKWALLVHRANLHGGRCQRGQL